MTIQTTIRRSWLMAAVITLLTTGQANAQGMKIGNNANFEKSNVGIQHKKQLHRAGRPSSFSDIPGNHTSYKDAAGNTSSHTAEARALRTGRIADIPGNLGDVGFRQQASEERVRDVAADHKDWLLPEGIPIELFDEFVYQWLVSDMNSEPLLEGDLDRLMSLEIEGWMTEYIRLTENGWMTEY